MEFHGVIICLLPIVVLIVAFGFSMSQLEKDIEIPVSFGTFRELGTFPEEVLCGVLCREGMLFVVANNCNHIEIV